MVVVLDPDTYDEADAAIRALPQLGERQSLVDRLPDTARPFLKPADSDDEEHAIVFPYVITGVVTYRLASICHHFPGVSYREALVRLAGLRNQEFESHEALDEAIRVAMGCDNPDGRGRDLAGHPAENNVDGCQRQALRRSGEAR